MYPASTPPPRHELQPPKDITASIAQRLYDHFSQMRLNGDEWLSCLEQFLVEAAETEGARVSLDEVKDRIRSIITVDKAIPLERLTDRNRQEIFREVAEWLVAEKICEKMVTYEQSITEGLKDGIYKPIHSIEKVMVIKDDDVFHGKNTFTEEEVGQFIKENYVVKTMGKPLGRGARVEVRELVPLKFPLPYPTRDERKEGLMILIPNRCLVIRILRESYRDSLGEKMDESELDAIDAFKLASELLVFSNRETSAITDIGDETCDDMAKALPAEARPAKPVRRTVKHSFIPPLIILKATLNPENPPEYLTIQKKVARKGYVSPGDKDMTEDLDRIKGLKKKIREFITACKRFYREEKMLPDTVGNGNVLYTARGNVYLVDINNITGEPDFEFVALVLHYKKIFYTAEFSKNSVLKKEYLDLLAPLETEIRSKLSRGNGRRNFSWEEISTVIENIYIRNDMPAVQKFLRQTGIIDDIGVSVYLHNLQYLLHLEDGLLQHDLKQGAITEDEYEQKHAALKEEPIYRPICVCRGPWLNKRLYEIRDIIINKESGLDNWVAEYTRSLYSILNNTSTMA
jgi:hypothetical protein